MATFAAPVHHDAFLYSTVLYADAGNQNRHPRAGIAELTALLRPEVAKGKKAASSQKIEPAKDQVGHWYTAQLIHYGLPPTKDKNAAKVRLLNALNEGKLEVPAWVTKLEMDLKKQWESENRKLKKAAKGTAHIGTTQKPVKKEATSAVDTGTASKSVKKETKRSTAAAGRVNADKKNENGTATTSVAKSTNLPPSTESIAKKRKRDNAAEPKAGKGSGKPNAKKVDTGEKATMSKSSGSRTKQTVRKSVFPVRDRSGSRTKQTARKSAFPIYESLPKQASDNESDPEDPDDIIFSGVYSITCPEAKVLFPDLDDDDLSLTLCRDDRRDAWWAVFGWGDWDGVIQMKPGPSYETLGEPCSLGWRLRDAQTEELRFGQRCTGEMIFYSDMTIRGCLFNVPHVGTVEFDGPRLDDANYGQWDGDACQEEWDGFVQEAYGR